MHKILTEHERIVHDNHLKSIFQEIESADDPKQYTLLLQASESAFLLGEIQEALSYLLQASLIADSYEIHTVLFFLHASQEQWKDAQTHLEKATQKHYPQLEVLSWEKLHLWIEDIDLPSDLTLLLEKLKSASSSAVSSPSSFSFQEILKEDPLHAAKIFTQWRDDSGLPSKYPELTNVSIQEWEKEFPDRKEQIEQKESLRQQNVALDFEELMKLGRMYLLENEFEKAAECFSSAKDLHYSALS